MNRTESDTGACGAARRHTRLGILIALVIVMLPLAARLHAGPLEAATLTVCPSGPPTCGYAQIQAAIDASSPGDTIAVAAGTYTETVQMTTSLTLAGAGPGLTVIDGAGGTVVEVDGAAASISGVTIANGSTGLGVYGPAQVTLGNSVVSGSSSRAQGGGIVNQATLVLVNSAVVGNSAPGGGGIRNDGMLTLLDSTIADNDGGAGGGGLLNNGALSALGSTIMGNSASLGGGIDNTGALTIENSTVAGNDGPDGGGGLANVGGTAAVSDSTLSSNTGSGGGIAVVSGTVTLANSILAGNSDGTGAPSDCAGAVASAGYNVVGSDGGCTFQGGAGDQVGSPGNPIDPRLGPLQNNGGTTWTMLPLADSPAVDQVPAASCALATDQRGQARPDEQSDQGACDVGAVELQAATTFFDDFSADTPGLPPSGYLLRGTQMITPTVQQVGGSGPAYNVLTFPDVPWLYDNKWAIKDGLAVAAPYTTTVKLNFQESVADRAGLTLAWNDASGDHIDIQPNIFWQDIEFRVSYSGPYTSNLQLSGPATHSGGLSFTAQTDYWLRTAATSGGPGQGQVVVYWSSDDITFTPVLTATGLADVSGLVGLGTAGPHLPNVNFDDFEVDYSNAAPPPTATPSPTPGPPTATPTSTATPGPSLAFTPGSGSYGQQLTISGTGFGPSETVTIGDATEPGVFAYTGTTTPGGTFVISGTVPAAPFGPHLLTASGQTSGLQASNTFNELPLAVLAHTASKPGRPDAVSGYGYGATEPITVYLDKRGGATLGSGGSDGSGSFGGATAITLTVPRLSAGSYNVVTVGASSGAVYTSTLTVMPALTISPASGKRGSAATVAGTGFGANEAVTVKWSCANVGCSSTTVLGTATTNGKGVFGGLGVTIPQTTTLGTHYVGGTGSLSSAFSATRYNVMP